MPSSPALAYAAASLSTYRRLAAPRAVTSSCTPDRPSAIGTRMLDRPHTYRRSKFGDLLASARAIRDPKRDVTRCWPRGAQRMLHALAIVMLRGEYARTPGCWRYTGSAVDNQAGHSRAMFGAITDSPAFDATIRFATAMVQDGMSRVRVIEIGRASCRERV